MKTISELPNLPELLGRTRGAATRRNNESWESARDKRDRAIARSPFVTDEDREAFRIMDGLNDGLRACLATNQRANKILIDGLWRGLRDIQRSDKRLQFALVTIIDQRLQTSDQSTVLRLKPMSDAARKILSSMSGDFIASSEIQTFCNRRHIEGGLVVSPHVHAIVFGEGVLEQGKDKAAAWNTVIPCGKDGCAPVDVRPLPKWPDVANALIYPLKAPNRMKTDYVHPRTGKRNIHQSEKGDRYIRFLRQYQLLTMLQRDRMIFSGGDGAAVRRMALKLVHEHLDALTAPCSRAENMEWVREFWEEFLPRIGCDRFKMPVIEV